MQRGESWTQSKEGKRACPVIERLISTAAHTCHIIERIYNSFQQDILVFARQIPKTNGLPTEREFWKAWHKSAN